MPQAYQENASRGFPTHPHSQVDLFVPLRVLLVPDDLRPSLVSGKVDGAVRIDELLLNGTNMEELLYAFKVAGVHLGQVFTAEHTDGQCGWDETYAGRTEQISVFAKIVIKTCVLLWILSNWHRQTHQYNITCMYATYVC